MDNGMHMYLKCLGSIPCCLMVERIMESFAPLTNAVAASGVRRGVLFAAAESYLRPPLMYIFLWDILNLCPRGVVAR